MLLVDSESICDVCLDGFSTVVEMSAPHVLKTCGHVFCFACLRCLSRPLCPLCRQAFDMETDVLKLRTGDKISQSPPKGPFASVVDDTDCSEATKHRNTIASIVEHGCLTRALREKTEEISAWLRAQPRDQHFDLRTTHRLLCNYRREISDRAKEREDLQNMLDDLETRIWSQKERFEDLSHRQEEELQTAHAVEKSLREHGRKAEEEWRQKFAALKTQCDRLAKELRHCRSSSVPSPLDLPAWPGSNGAEQDYFAGWESPHDSRSGLTIALEKARQNEAGAETMFEPIPSTPEIPDDHLDFAPILSEDERAVPRDIRRSLDQRSQNNYMPLDALPFLHAEPFSSQSLPRSQVIYADQPSSSRSRSKSINERAQPAAIPVSGHPREAGEHERRRRQLRQVLDQMLSSDESHPSDPKPAPRPVPASTSTRSSKKKTSPKRTRTYPDVQEDLGASQSYTPPSTAGRPRTQTMASLPGGQIPLQSKPPSPPRPIISASSAALEAERLRSVGPREQPLLPPLGRPAYLQRMESPQSMKARPPDYHRDRYPVAVGIPY